uniref:Uncharacterized protein n=1 Tax=Quercus lobata TaxID=97700 RepID=A0A7N2RC07_QUELO
MSRLLLLLHSRTLTSHLCNSTLTPTLTQTQSLSPSPSFPLQLQTFSFRSSFSSKTKNSKQQEQEQEEADKVGNEAKNKNKKINNSSSESSVRDSDYPSGEFQLQEFSWWRKLTVKLMMLTALPRERIPNATFLTMKIRGEIFEQLESRYSSELSLPQICENIIKAAYDPRISGIYLHIETLSCGWAKIDEIQRHILDFKKSVSIFMSFGRHDPTLNQLWLL